MFEIIMCWMHYGTVITAKPEILSRHYHWVSACAQFSRYILLGKCLRIRYPNKADGGQEAEKWLCFIGFLRINDRVWYDHNWAVVRWFNIWWPVWPVFYITLWPDDLKRGCRAIGPPLMLRAVIYKNIKID